MSYKPLINGHPGLLHGGDYNPDQWLDRPETIAEDFRLMKLSGCDAFSVGIFSWSSYEPEEGRFEFGWLDGIMDRMAENGFRVNLATPSAAAPLWMALKYPEIKRVDANGERFPNGPYDHRHNQCWTSPVYREKVSTINRKLAERYAKHPALGAWHVANEYSGACYCGLCVKEFQRWLERRYGTLDALNAAWWTSFWSHRYGAWSEINPRRTCLDGMAVDWKRFTTWQCCQFMRNETAPLRELAPETPVTTNMMGTNDFFIDNWPLAEVCDFISDDAYCFWDDADEYIVEAARKAFMHDMHRSMKGGRPFLVMEHGVSSLNWTPYYRLKRPGVHKLEILNAIGHGADGTLFFQWRKSRGSMEKFHAAPVDHVGHENTRVFKEIRETSELQRRIAAVAGAGTPVRAAVIHDWEVRWALEASSGPSRDSKKHLDTLFAHHRALYKLNVPCEVVESVCDFDKYDLLVAPMLFMLRQGVAKRLKDFVARGGTLVCTYLSGYVDETNLCFEGGFPGDGLRELFGIWNEELDGFTPKDEQSVRALPDNALGIEGEFKAVDFAERIHLEGARSLASYGHDFYAGEPAATVNEYGEGEAYYIAARTGDEFLSEFYGRLARRIGLETPIPHGNPEGVHACVRVNGERRFLFLFNWNKKGVEADLGPKRYRDMLDGREVSGRVALAPYASTVMEEIG